MYKDMSNMFKNIQIGEYRLENFEITPENQSFRNPIPYGKYVRLLKGSGLFTEVIMSNTPMEMRRNAEFVRKAHGNILIAGLGIGMILLAIQDKPMVKSITVVEYSPEVMQMVLPQLPLNNKVKVVQQNMM